MSTPRYSLKAYERLKSKKQVGRLFDSGKSQFIYPFKLFYLIEAQENPQDWPVQFSVSIPKKKIKGAVQRNLLKRRTREAYRLNKLPLDSIFTNSEYKISLMLVYMEKEVKKYNVLEKSIIKHLNELNRKVNLMD